ncbi:cytochrome c1 [Achromobacter sp. F4_2707]|uniref:cytochrome c1 n=1 Tax=Achromobacter sp. F4_2707 TaxID=3114286 RepID=UPI0039C5C9B4
MIKKLIGTIALSLTCAVSFAAGGGYALEKAPSRINDMASLQNGAKLFVNYCLGCHSANSMRYNRLTDIGLTEEQIKRNLLFTGEGVGDLMKIAMTREDATKWFGAAPPDLSVIARAKSTNLGPTGVDYIYTFLRTFYRDTNRPLGWDNLVFPSVGMPHALWDLQGPRSMERNKVSQVQLDNGETQWQRTITTFDPQGFSETTTEVLQGYSGGASEKITFTPVDPKAAAEFDNQAADLANFLGWMAEPVQLERKRLGVWVLLFLFLFFGVAWKLNAVYWKDVK